MTPAARTSKQILRCVCGRLILPRLCGACNTAIGLLRDDPNIVIAASDYLKRVLIHVA